VRTLTAAINSLLEEVNKQVDQQRRFIGDAAHQLRTPLAGLKSQTELVKAELQGQTPDIPRACRQLEQVETSVARSIHLVNQLLALARAEPESGLQRSVLDLNQLTREVTAEAVPRALARGLDLGLDSGDEKMPVQAMPACCASCWPICWTMPSSTPRPGAKSPSNCTASTQLRLAVRDNGPGIAAAERDKVFQRFYRVNTSPAAGLRPGAGHRAGDCPPPSHPGGTERQPPHGLCASLLFKPEDGTEKPVQ
jgi:two-component system sensor histidine kinase TctE